MVGAVTPGSLLVLGDLCVDIVVETAVPPEFGQVERVVSATTVTVGGSSAITAVGASKLGVETMLVSAVGDDVLGRFLLGELHASGVDTHAIEVRNDIPTGSSTLLTLPDGDRSILTALGAIGTTRVQDVPADALGRADRVHVGSYFLQQALHGHLGDFFAACRDRGIATSLDPNFDPTERWASGIVDALPHCDVFFCNEREATAIAGSDVFRDAAVWLTSLLPDGAELVLKRGPLGAVVYSDDAPDRPVPTPAAGRRLIDTIGAGDSLAAGYLAGRLRGLSPGRSLAIGVRNGTASTCAVGGVNGQLTWTEVEGETPNRG